jgi:hypothetical protein
MMAEIYGIPLHLDDRSGAIVCNSLGTDPIYEGSAVNCYSLDRAGGRGHQRQALNASYANGVAGRAMVVIFPSLPVGNYELESVLASTTRNVQVFPNRVTETTL